MLSVYKNEFLSEMPLAFCFLLSGLCSFCLPKEILTSQISWYYVIPICFIPILFIASCFWYKNHHKKRQEPFDDLTLEHKNKANTYSIHINQFVLLLVASIVVFFRQDAFYCGRIAGAIYIYLGLEKLIRFLLFVHIDKQEMKVEHE